MNRKKKFLVVDVESPGTGSQALTYDIGYAVTDNDGYIYDKGWFVVRDIFSRRPDLMVSAYYAEKIPMYHDAIAEGRAILKWFAEVQQILLAKIAEYNIKVVAAYNANFDIGALNRTAEYVFGEKSKFFPEHMEVNCIWHMACQVLFTERKYAENALKNEWYSEAHNLRTTAEHAFKYMDNQLDFEEENTGLADVEIEVQIMTRCFGKRRKMDRSPKHFCWKIPNDYHRERIKIFFNQS